MIAQTTFKGYTITVDYDDEPNNPLSYETLGTILYWPSSPFLITSAGEMTLGHYNKYLRPQDFLDAFDPKSTIMLPVYLYRGKTIQISTDPKDFKSFDPKGWQWGQVGYVYTTKDKIGTVYGWTSLSSARKGEVINALREEVSIYNQYISGDVYRYEITDEGGNVVVSASELYYGSPAEIIKHARAWITQTTAREKLDVTTQKPAQ